MECDTKSLINKAVADFIGWIVITRSSLVMVCLDFLVG
jgi:hypothetical protein